jgi:hypothetical protein
MTELGRPFFVVYVVWHPESVRGPAIAEEIRKHFRRKLFENVAGGTGLSVIFRFMPVPGTNKPLEIDLLESDVSAVIVISERVLVADRDWNSYVHELAEQAESIGFRARIFPVALEKEGLEGDIVEQALRWDKWPGSGHELQQRLTRELTYEFCRMLRFYLEHIKRPEENERALEAYLKKVQIFISHSKHDDDGERIAYEIRQRLHAGHGLASFFDVHDIPAGLRFNKVLLHNVRTSAVVAIHTDTYSSREWCRREIIEAKRWNVPLVVANCISDVDERGFPYMGNVPAVRMEPNGPDRIDIVVGRLLDEVLKDFLWKCRVELIRGDSPPWVIFIPRPPELISLTAVPQRSKDAEHVVVYPDPPLSSEESSLFEQVAPNVTLLSLTEWQARESK